MPRPARVPWAALGVGAVCVPALTIVALTEEPQALVRRPKVPSAAGVEGGDTDSDSSRAAEVWWLPLAQQLERLQQLAYSIPEELGGYAEGSLQEESDERETGRLNKEMATADAPAGATSTTTVKSTAVTTTGTVPAEHQHHGGSWQQRQQRQQQQQQQRHTWPRVGSRDVPASQLAAEWRQDMAEMRRLAEAELAHLSASKQPLPGASSQCRDSLPAAQLPPRFTDAELMRFAMMHGLLRAATPAQRQAALREGAAAAARTACWLREHPFSSEAELQRFAHLVSWQGTDEQGHPVLHINIGRAVAECRGGAALAFSNAVITHMEQGLSCRLRDWVPPVEAGSGGHGSADLAASTSDAPASASARSVGASSADRDDSDSGAPAGAGDSWRANGPPRARAACWVQPDGDAAAAQQAAAARPAEQVVVVMDCTGASTLNAARISWVFQAVASSLSHHYPGRLHELVLLDLPLVLSWMVSGVKAMVHPDTRHKFRVVSSSDGAAYQQRQQPAERAVPAGEPLQPARAWPTAQQEQRSQQDQCPQRGQALHPEGQPEQGQLATREPASEQAKQEGWVRWAAGGGALPLGSTQEHRPPAQTQTEQQHPETVPSQDASVEH